MFGDDLAVVDDDGADLVLELPSGSSDEGSGKQEVLLIERGRGHNRPDGSRSLGCDFEGLRRKEEIGD